VRDRVVPYCEVEVTESAQGAACSLVRLGIFVWRSVPTPRRSQNVLILISLRYFVAGPVTLRALPRPGIMTDKRKLANYMGRASSPRECFALFLTGLYLQCVYESYDVLVRPRIVDRGDIDSFYVRLVQKSRR
jgi:hypothetical protein